MDNNIFENDQNKIEEIDSNQLAPNMELNKIELNDKTKDDDQNILDKIEAKSENNDLSNEKRKEYFNKKYLIIGIIVILVIIIIILICITLFFPKVDNKLVTDLQKTVVNDNIKISDLTNQINTLKDKQKYIITSNKQLQEENDDLKKYLLKYCSMNDSKIEKIETKINKEPIIIQEKKNEEKPKIEEVKIEDNIDQNSNKEDLDVKKIISELI